MASELGEAAPAAVSPPKREVEGRPLRAPDRLAENAAYVCQTVSQCATLGSLAQDLGGRPEVIGVELDGGGATPEREVVDVSGECVTTAVEVEQLMGREPRHALEAEVGPMAGGPGLDGESNASRTDWVEVDVCEQVSPVGLGLDDAIAEAGAEQRAVPPMVCVQDAYDGRDEGLHGLGESPGAGVQEEVEVIAHEGEAVDLDLEHREDFEVTDPEVAGNLRFESMLAVLDAVVDVVAGTGEVDSEGL
ncbi:MAG: hypothetical protein R3F61_05045 [Myxococcota bacterium]